MKSVDENKEYILYFIRKINSWANMPGLQFTTFNWALIKYNVAH